MSRRTILLDDHAHEYRRTTGRLGVIMLVFLALFSGLGYVGDLLLVVIFPHTTGKSFTVVIELINMTVYLLSFMLPVLVYRLLSPRRERIPMMLEPRLPRHLWLVLPAAIALVYCTAIANSFFVRALGLTGVSSSAPAVDALQPHEAILLYMATALVPAFCEEFLFRGLILPELLPYGRTTAVLGSAILFGLMHQSFDQMLYATVAGIVLALVAMESGSIWGGVIIHLFNNLLSVVDEVLIRSLPYQIEMILYAILEILVVGGGLVCLAILIVRRQKHPQKPVMAAGTPPEGGALRGFFSPLMIAFWVVCIIEMILWTIANLM